MDFCTTIEIADYDMEWLYASACLTGLSMHINLVGWGGVVTEWNEKRGLGAVFYISEVLVASNSVWIYHK